METMWYRLIQTAVDVIDEAIREGGDERLTLDYLANRLGYSPFHTTRMFRALSGMSLREYLGLRRLAFAFVEVRDTEAALLDIAVRHGFSSNAAFSRAFKAAYGVTPTQYRRDPVPVVLRTLVRPFDCYLLEYGLTTQEESAMDTTANQVKTYFARIPAHKFLHIKNYESDGYFDFWQKQDKVPGMDCDTICGLLDSIKGKLDGDDNIVGEYTGQVMGYPQEAGGKSPEAYGIRLAADHKGKLPEQMLVLDVPEGEYLVVEHGPFDYETECETVFRLVDETVEGFPYRDSGYQRDNTPGRVAYYYHDPARYLKWVIPVKKSAQ